MIIVPDSVAYYWRDPVNDAAINVLGGSSDVPTDLSLDEAERFELAALAARRVRVEFWRMLRQLRVAIWDGAVRLSFPDARRLGYGEHQAVANAWEQYADPSLARAWEARATGGVHQLRGGAHLFTRVQLSERDRELGLQLYHGVLTRRRPSPMTSGRSGATTARGAARRYRGFSRPHAGRNSSTLIRYRHALGLR